MNADEQILRICRSYISGSSTELTRSSAASLIRSSNPNLEELAIGLRAAGSSEWFFARRDAAEFLMDFESEAKHISVAIGVAWVRPHQVFLPNLDLTFPIDFDFQRMSSLLTKAGCFGVWGCDDLGIFRLIPLIVKGSPVLLWRRQHVEPYATTCADTDALDLVEFLCSVG
jgi:hypothetical protein